MLSCRLPSLAELWKNHSYARSVSAHTESGIKSPIPPPEDASLPRRWFAFVAFIQGLIIAQLASLQQGGTQSDQRWFWKDVLAV